MSAKYTYPNYVKPEGAYRVGILTPSVGIAVIEEGNKARYDAELSLKNQENVLKITQEMVGSQVLSKEIMVDTATQHAIFDEVFGTSQKMATKQNKIDRQAVIDSYQMSNQLDSLMKTNEIDQLIVCYQRGFTRTKSNYVNQSLKGLGIGLLTLGMFVPIAIKANSTIETCVLDRTKRTIVFRNTIQEETDPVKIENLMTQLCELYVDFYTIKPQYGSCFHL